MHIGIAGPIILNRFIEYLHLTKDTLTLGMGGTAINLLIKGLLERGHRVSVFTLDRNITEKLRIDGPRLTVYVAPFRKKAAIRMLDLMYREWYTLSKLMKEAAPDIVHAHWSYEYAVAAIISGLPHLITLRDHVITIVRLTRSSYRLMRLLMDSWVRRNGQNFTVNSPYLAGKIKNIKNPPVIIPNPVERSQLAHNEREKPKHTLKVFSALTGWSAIKNPENGIKGFQMARKKILKSFEYHLFGPGYEEKGAGWQWARNNNLLDNTFWHGPIDHLRLLKDMDQFDILLHPSREESFGNSVLEAMAKGIPVIGGEKSGAVPWVMGNGSCGPLVDIESPVAISDALVQLFQDDDRYTEYSHNGLKRVAETFLNELVTADYLNTYRKILT